MSTVRALLPALGAGFAFTLGGPAETLAFGPQAGSVLTKTFTIGGEYELDQISLNVNGQDMSGMLGEIQVSLEQESRIEVTDTYTSVEDGRPRELLRSFEDLSGKMSMEVSPGGAEMPQFESSSPLEGKTVAFKWDAEKEEYELTFQDGEGEEDWLADLEEDMDLRIFLPSSEVEAGASWTVELERLQGVVMPGGNLHLEPEGMEVDEESMKMFEDLFGDLGQELGDLLEGECKCTYKGTQDDGGVRVAEIAIEVEVATTLDLAAFLDKGIRGVIEQQGAGDSVDFSIETADFGFDFDGSGTLLWNLAAGRMHSFQLNGDVTIDMDLAVRVEVEGESQAMDASLEMSGTLREEVATKE